MKFKRVFACCFSSSEIIPAPTETTPLPQHFRPADRQRAKTLTRQLSHAAVAHVVPRDASFLVNIKCDRHDSTPPATSALPTSATKPTDSAGSNQQWGNGTCRSSFQRLSSVHRRGSANIYHGPQQKQQHGAVCRGAPPGTAPVAPGQQLTGTALADGRPTLLNWTESRRQLEQNLAAEQTVTQQQDGPDYLSEHSRLLQRLARLKLVSVEAVGDGNCQFRAVSQQLYGTQEHHAFVRRRAVEHIRSCSQEFSAFLGDDFEVYVHGMGQDGCWGDELTLRAVCDSFGVVVHVVTNEQHNWYLKYTPLQLKSAQEVFLTYISPIHYNSLRRQTTAGRPPSTGKRAE